MIGFLLIILRINIFKNNMNLYSHQKRIIEEDKKKIGLFLGTGTGKTKIALSLARGNVLVICPKTQKEDRNWEREWNTKEVHDADKINLTVISKEEFRRDWKMLPKFDTVIVDEAHTVLGVTPSIKWVKKQPFPKVSQLFEALSEYLEAKPPECIYLCTATIIRSPMTVWGAAKILGAKWDFYRFRETFYIRLPMPGREVWMPKKDDETKEKLAELVRKLGYVGRLEDFFDVPAQTYKTIHLGLSKAQKDAIKDIPLDYPDAIVRVGKIHQIENGVLSGDEFNVPKLFDNAKIEKILELAVEFPRMVIFAKYKAQIGMIKEHLEANKYNVLVMTGETTDRGSLIKEANETKECIFICQAQISAGWELPEYPVMVFASRTYSFVDYSQALGRIQRANNIKKNLYINLVVKGGVDEVVDRCLLNKQDFDERIYQE